MIRRAVVAAAVLLALVSTSTALTAANTVVAGRADDLWQGLTADQLKPAACAGIPVAAVVGSGTTQSDLVLGTAGVDTLDGAQGDDCLVGGAGDDRFVGGAGQDVCLGGAGVDTFAGCETAVQD